MFTLALDHSRWLNSKKTSGDYDDLEIYFSDKPAAFDVMPPKLGEEIFARAADRDYRAAGAAG